MSAAMLGVHPSTGFVELAPLAIGGIDLVWVIGALMCLLVLAGGWVILWILHLALGRISILGVRPFDFFYTLATAALQSMAGQLVKRTLHLAHWIWAMVMTVWRPLYVILETLGYLLAQITGVNQQAQQGLAAARAQEQADIGQLRTQEQADIGRLTGTFDQAIAGIEQQLGQDVGALQAREAADVASIEARISATALGLEAAIGAGMASLTNTLNADVASLENWLTATTNILHNEIVNGVNGAEAVAARDLTAAEQFTTSSINLAAPGIVAQAVSRLAPRLSKIETEVTECLDPLCSTVTPQAPRLGRLGNHLGNLEGLGIEAVLIAAAAECLTNPAAVRNDVITVTQDVGSAVMTGFRDLIGA